MPGHDIIVVGASAGGIQPVLDIARSLPPDFPAAVFIVVHTPANSPGLLATLIDNVGPLPARNAIDGEPIHHGTIYVAPPDHHLLLKDSIIRVTRGPKENGFRPAVDPLFRTAAYCCGARVVGVVLSGSLDDGTEGLQIIKHCGGHVLIQDPQDATHPDMPANAAFNVQADKILPIAQIPGELLRLAHEPISRQKAVTMECRETGPDVAERGGDGLLHPEQLPGPPSRLTCPECGGAIWEVRNGDVIQYRCHVGHTFTEQSLVAEQDRELEAALWTAVRALEESAALRRRLAERASRWPTMAKHYTVQAEQARRKADLVRQVLLRDMDQLGKQTPPSRKPSASRASRNGNPNGNGKRKSNGKRARPLRRSHRKLTP